MKLALNAVLIYEYEILMLNKLVIRSLVRACCVYQIWDKSKRVVGVEQLTRVVGMEQRLCSRGDQQPEKEWSRSRNLVFFVGTGVDSESQFFRKTGAGAGIQLHE